MDAVNLLQAAYDKLLKYTPAIKNMASTGLPTRCFGTASRLRPIRLLQQASLALNNSGVRKLAKYRSWKT